jgi:hypothetical protein
MNAAGLSSETNIVVVKSLLNMTINPVTGNLWLPTVRVSGLISDPTAAIYVNGVQGINNGDGTWAASDVPVTPGGVASFDLNAVPAGGGDPTGNDTRDKPDEEVVDSATWGSDSEDVISDQTLEVEHAGGNYTQAGGGTYWICDESKWVDNQETYYTAWTIYVLAPGGMIVDRYSYDSEGHYGDSGPGGPFPFAMEYGELSAPPGDYYYQDKNSKVKVKYNIGGAGTAGLVAVVTVSLAGANPQVELTQPYFGALGGNIDFTFVNIPGLGKNLGPDGNAYGLGVVGGSVDVTPTVDGVDMYSFSSPGVGLSVPIVTANGQGLDPGDIVPGAEFCVGEGITFNVAWDYSVPPYDDAGAEWALPGTFVNEPDSSQGSLYYYKKGADLYRIYSRDRTLGTGCWYVKDFQADTASVVMYLHFANGQNVTINAFGQFSIFRPTATFTKPIPTHGSPTVGIINGTLALGQNGNQDMSFEHTINAYDAQIGTGFSGSAGYVQLLQGSYEDHFSQNTLYQIPDAGSDPAALDNALFPRGTANIDGNLGGTPIFYDAPSLELPPDLSPVTENMQFSTYLLFAPSGGIYVPLRLVTWKLNMSATYNGGWQPSSSPTVPSDADCTSFPEWTQTYTNQKGIIQ